LLDRLAEKMLAHGVTPQIKAGDVSHILKARQMSDQGRLAGAPDVQFGMGASTAIRSAATSAPCIGCSGRTDRSAPPGSARGRSP
jgi:uncharacterized protein (DUF849 family)